MSEWKKVKFEDIALLSGENVQPADARGLPYIGLEHIGESSLSLIGFGKADQVMSTKKRFTRGDILFGKLRPYFRKLIRAPFDGVCSTDIWVIRSKDISNIDYLFYLMASDLFIEPVVRSSQGTRMPRAIWEFVSSLEFPLPPLSEQKAIAHILGSLDDKIELNRRMNETLEAMARAIFKDWFVDFGPTRAKLEGRNPYLPEPIWSLFPDAIDPQSGLPIGWENTTLKRLVQFNPSENLRKGVKAPYLGMNALPTQGSIPDPPTLRTFSSGMRFRNGDTLFARITPCLENGKTAFIQNLMPNEIGWGSTEFIVMRSIPPVPKVFTYLIARDPSFRTTAIQSMTGTSGRQRVRTEALENYVFCKPQNKIWECFAFILNPMFDKIASHDIESRTLAELRDRLLPKLMSGQIRVKDAEKLVEEVL